MSLDLSAAVKARQAAAANQARREAAGDTEAAAYCKPMPHEVEEYNYMLRLQREGTVA